MPVVVSSKSISEFPTPPKQVISPELFTIAFGNRGNSGGNNVNGGFAMCYRDKLFFSDSSVSNRLASLDANGLRILTNFAVSNINATDNWIYFCNESDEKRIYKCRTDGSELSTVSGVSASSPHVSGQWIYFSNLNDDRKLYRVSIDGNQLEKICNDSVADINAYPETVYYKNTSDNSSIYHICTDGTDHGRIINKTCSHVNAYGMYLFYINLSDNTIYRSSFDGIYIQSLGRKAVCINVLEDYVYFSDSAAIYRMDFNGENCKKLADASTEKISVIGSTVYYIEKESGNLYVLYKNGDTLVNEPLSGKYYKIQ